MEKVTRREFGALAATGFATMVVGTACQASAAAEQIRARPRGGTTTSAKGTEQMGLGGARDAILQIPSKPAAGALPLLVLLHGAGGGGAGILRRLGTFADENGIAVLAPDSRAATWDAIRGDFRADPEFLNRALERVFERVAADPERIAIGGFSDGATYALSLGLANGDLFRSIIAFSPGFYVGGVARGKPRIYVSHGINDEILPIDRCSRLIVPSLNRRGYEVTFRQFPGGHEIPGHIAREGMKFVSKG